MQAYAAFNHFDASNPAAAPALLSQTGLYTNIQGKVLDTSAKYFDVNSALWSDAAAKQRRIILKPGRHIAYDDTADLFDYPDSTVFVKTFSLVRSPGDTVHWETRLLIKKQGSGASPVDWYGFSYRWNAAQSDARLVPPGQGFDTVFFATDARGRRTYKKWRFPSQGNCNSCHIGRGEEGASGQVEYGRGVLGFFPAQLKRPSSRTPATDQVLDLFNQGVFTGTRPTVSQLARRFKGIQESLPPGPGARAAAIDTMARSYIAANCSGCHGARGNALHVTGEVFLDYDFQTVMPRMDFGMRPAGDRGLFAAVPYDTNDVSDGPKGRAYYLAALAKWGFQTASGAWDMALPPAENSVLIYPGHPAASALLFRQWARKSPWTDSGAVARALKYEIQFGDPPEKARAEQRRAWYFSRPWGSQAWQDTLGKHGLGMDSLIALVNRNGGFYGEDGNQMPPLATFEPDTAALRLLGEWVKGYQEPIVGVRHGAARWTSTMPVLRGRVLVLPRDWMGPVDLVDIRGRSRRLMATMANTFALPPFLPPGVYVFRAGPRLFRASVLVAP